MTNIDRGFASLIAHHFGADYTTICRSGNGMVCDWRGDHQQSIPIRFDRAWIDVPSSRWDFSRWVPDVVVICLGLNDHSGLRDRDGRVPEEQSTVFRSAYHDFFRMLRARYPLVTIVAAAAFPEWICSNVRRVVVVERESGRRGIFYATFDEFHGGHVVNGHPTVVTHQRMADQVIGAMESFGLFREKK